MLITATTAPRGSRGGVSFAHWSKTGVFALQERHVTPTNVAWERTPPQAKFHIYR